jgi:2-hydroxy-3-keto-5-methylthiopentenyl-1-phosphate phosphatase
MHIICDFDATISRGDSTDVVRGRLADPDAELDALLDTVTLDPGFLAFVAWCAGHRLSISIVSEGVDHFIYRILERHRLGRLPVFANRLAGVAGARVLDQPWAREGCAAGASVCVCALSGAWSEPKWPMTVYVGDGRSGFCVSARADLLFARAALADYAMARAQPFIVFDTFDDVTRTLERRLGKPTTEVAARPRRR